MHRELRAVRGRLPCALQPAVGIGQLARKGVTAITSIRHAAAENRLHFLDDIMTGSTATLLHSFGRVDRVRSRGLHWWRRGWARHNARANSNSATSVLAAPVLDPDDDSAWTAEEQRLLRALREAGL